MNSNDNFDALWEDLKEQVRKARGERNPIYTMGENALTQLYGLRLQIGSLSKDETGKGYAYIHASIPGATLARAAYAEDLRAIAVECIAASLDIEDAKQ